MVDGTSYQIPSYSYNLAGALVSQTYPSGRVVQNDYDDGGKLSVVTGQAPNQAVKTYASNFDYSLTDSGATNRVQLGNGRWESVVYNKRLQPTLIGLGTTQNGTELMKLEYNYGTTDNNGNVHSQTITTPTAGSSAGFTAVQSYGYDNLNRLTSAAETSNGQASWQQTFSYNQWGNRQVVTNATTTALIGDNPSASDANNRIVPQSGELYQYDAAGNLITDRVGNTYSFDGENLQAGFTYTGSSQSAAQYFYDGEGRRVKKVVGNNTTVFVYDALGKLVAEYESNPQPGSATTYLSVDNLGTPRVTTDSSGNVQARHDYLPFGEEIAAYGGRSGHAQYHADSLRKKYTGFERDDENGLDYAQARYYASAAGRFTSVDPYNIVIETEITATTDPERAQNEFTNYLSRPQSWNRYAYVINNPLKYIDPTGEELELTGDEADIRAGFDRIKDLVGSKAAKLLYLRKKNGRTYVDYRGTRGDDRKGMDALLGVDSGGINVYLVKMINSPKTVEFRVATTFDTKYEKGLFTASGRCGGGCTVGAEESLTDSTQIFVHPDAGNKTQEAFNVYANGEKVSPRDHVLDFYNDIDDAHEFGHAFANMIEGLPIRNSNATNARSIQFEELIRKQRYPENRARRIAH